MQSQIPSHSLAKQTKLKVQTFAFSESPRRSDDEGGESESSRAQQEVGDAVILNCSSEREVHLCRWKTPYLNTYIVGEGIYVERGRIAWAGSNPNFDCTIRVSNLELRDAGAWVCEIGSSTKDNFQVQTKEFQIDIESESQIARAIAPTEAMGMCSADFSMDDSSCSITLQDHWTKANNAFENLKQLINRVIPVHVFEHLGLFCRRLEN